MCYNFICYNYVTEHTTRLGLGHSSFAVIINTRFLCRPLAFFFPSSLFDLQIYICEKNKDELRSP